MNKKLIRPYEMSVWSLQDEFITVLKSHDIANKGQLISPKMTIKDDGTQELSFTVPMYYRDEGEYKENPLWYDIHNGAVLVNMRKIKVIFSKGTAKEEIFEFIISQVKETHTGSILNCEVTASGLAFQELGKIGYKKSLSQDDFLIEYEEWFEKQDAETAEPRATINYWCDKIFKGSKWTYSVQMDWSAYDGTVSGDKLYSKMSQSERDFINEAREKANKRRMDKVYEDDYVAAWDDELNPAEFVKFKEKERMVEAEKSNLYNITQTIAETFGVYCRYKYYYDNNYHIIGRECIFYNNYIDDRNGKIDITYPFDASQIERELDSTDLVTKMFVVPVDDEDSASGLVTIADVTANRSREDYILNFDYLYQIGSITDEQYKAVNTFEKQMFLINTKLTPIETHLAQAQVDLPEYEAKVTTAQNSQTLDKEQMEKANALLDSLTGGTGTLSVTASNPYRGILLTDPEVSGAYYIKISQAGVDATSIVIYTRYSNGSALDQYNTSTPAPDIRKDSCGNVVAIGNLFPVSDSKTFYLTFNYRPALQYENVYNTYAKKLIQDQSLEIESAKKVAQLKSTIESLKLQQKEQLELKQKSITDFENMMGPALKEGSWQAENYTDYGNKYNETFGFNSPTTTSGNLTLMWDSEHFDDEQLNYYKETVSLNSIYYLCYDLSSIRDKIKNNLDNLTYIYTPTGSTGTKYATIGSEAQYIFLRKDNKTIPALIITDENAIAGGRIGVVSVSVGTNGALITNVNELVSAYTLNSACITDPSSYKQVYPRIQVNSLLLKDTEDELMLRLNSQDLRKYYDYSVLTRRSNYYITIKSNLLIDKDFKDYGFSISYALSNAAMAVYLDALEVSKTNAYPQVSYTITVSAFKEELIKYLYTKLNSIVSINDSELKFDNVQGYISELELSLDTPWEDKLTIKNYKTKFEDLFSTIVASSEQMKSNGYIYDRAGSAFTSNGTIKNSVIQNTIMRTDLDYAFQNGDLTIDEVNGIWARSPSGVVAMAGGGIFCATYKDTLGNWVWNTGITPEGINASLLTAGQIDTNLIRIYSGNDLRFQMNGDGIYAYKDIPTPTAESSEYIVYNQNGVYFTQKSETSSVDRVALNWDGLTLRDAKGEKVLTANASGLSITGTVTAANGEIGGWLIDKYTLQSTNSYAGMRSAFYDQVEDEENKVYDVFWTKGRQYNETSKQWEDSGNTFSVDSNGILHASNAIITGTIIAKDGYVGSLNIATLERELKGIKIIALTGDTFKWSSDYSGAFQTPNSLSFGTVFSDVTIKKVGEAPSITFKYRVVGDTNQDFIDIESSWVQLNKNDFSFVISPSIMEKRDENNELQGYHDSVVIKEIAVCTEEVDGVEKEKPYEATIVLYSLFDGKSGSSGATPKFVQLNPVGYAFVKAKGSEVFLPESITITAMLSETVDAKSGEWWFNGNRLTKNTNLDVYVNPDNKSIVVKREGLPEGEDVGPSVISYKNDGREWLATVWKTEDGKDGTNGKDGEPGAQGPKGDPGAAGQPGENAVVYTLRPSTQFIRKSGGNNNYTYTPEEIVFDAYRTEGNTTQKYGSGTLTPYWSEDGTTFQVIEDVGSVSGSTINVNKYLGSMIKVVLTDSTGAILTEQTVMIMESGANGKDGKDGIIYEIRPSVNTIKRTSAGTNVPNSITFTAYKTIGTTVIPVEYNSGFIDLQISIDGINFTSVTGDMVAGGTATIDEVGNAVVLRAQLYDSTKTNLLDEQTVSVLQDGEAGISPIVMVLSNENTSVIMGDTGSTTNYLANCNTTVTIYEGLTDKTAYYINNNSLQVTSDSADTTFTTQDNITYSITGLNTDAASAFLTFKLTVDGKEYIKKFTISVLRNGAQGPQGNPGPVGPAGAAAHTILLTNEFIQFNAESVGDLNEQTHTCGISVYNGAQILGKDDYSVYFNGEKTATEYEQNGIKAVLNTDKNEITVTSTLAAANKPSGAIPLYFVVDELTYIRYLNYAIRFGAARYYITLSHSTIVKTNGVYDPTTIQVNAYYIKNSSADPAAYSNGKFIITAYGENGAVIGSVVEEKVSQKSYQVTAGTASIVIELQDLNGATLDRQSIPVLDSSVADVTVGGKNLLRWTRNMINRKNGVIDYFKKSDSVQLLDDGKEEEISLLYFNYNGTTAKSAWCNVQGMLIPEVGLNDIYTLSFYLYSDDYEAMDNTFILREYLANSDGTRQRYRDSVIIKKKALQTDDYNIRLIEGSPENDKWQRLAITYHPKQSNTYFDRYTNDSDDAAAATIYGLEILFETTTNMKIKKLKLEKGRLATDWSPSEYDVDYEDMFGVNLLNTSYYTTIYARDQAVKFDVKLEPGYYTLSWNGNMTEAYEVINLPYTIRSESYKNQVPPIYSERNSFTFYVETATTEFILYTSDDENAAGGYYTVAELKLQKGEYSTGYTMSPEEARNYYNQYLDLVNGKNETMKNYILSITDVDGKIQNFKEDEFQQYLDELERLNNDFIALSGTYNSLLETVTGLSKWESYYELAPQDNNRVALIIGDKSNTIDFKMRLDSGKLSFLTRDNEVAYMSNQKLYINYAEIVQQLRIGSSSDTGYLTFKHMDNGLGVIWEG